MNPDGITNILRRSLATTRQKLFECSRCRKKYAIPGAKETAVYKCVGCNLVMSEAAQGSALVESTDAELVLDEVLPPEVQQAMKNPNSVVGRFVILGNLEGDDTFHAFDVELMRHVSIHFIRQEIAEELRAIAGLEHKHIARIYDIGSVGGRGFVASQLIQGKTIDNAFLPEHARLETLAEVCDALEFAHRKAIFHGNISTRSIMVDGDSNIFLAGFGSGGKSSAPEDIRAMCKVVESLLNCAESPELNAIARKDYYSAELLGVDLRRYKNGYPVYAYSQTMTYRAKKAVRRNKLLIAAGVILMAALVVVGYTAYTKQVEDEKIGRERAESQAAQMKLAERDRDAKLAAEKEKAAARKLLAALLTDLSNAHKEAEQRRRNGENFSALCSIPKRILESAMYRMAKEQAESDAGFHYSMGRLYRMVGDEKNSYSEFKRSRELKPDDGATLYEIGVLEYFQYIDIFTDLREMWIRKTSMAKLSGGGDADPWDTPILSEIETEEAAGVRKSFFANLASAANLLPKDSSLHFTAMGVFEYSNGANEKAEDLLKKALELDMSSEDAAFFLSQVHYAMHDFTRTLAVLTNIVKNDRGNCRLIAERAMTYYYLANEQNAHGQSPIESYLSSIEDFNSALALNATSTEYIYHRGVCNMNMGAYGRHHGMDPTANYTDAIADFDRALQIDSDFTMALVNRAAAQSEIAYHKLSVGKDFAEHFKKAISDIDECILRHPQDGLYYDCRGAVRINFALCRMQTGQEPTPEFERAMADFEASLKLDASQADTWVHMGLACNNLGYFKYASGSDPTKQYQKAVECYREALKIGRQKMSVYKELAGTLNNLGLYKMDTRRDPSDEFKNSIYYVDKALGMDPGAFELWKVRGEVYLNSGDFILRCREDPGDAYAEAIRSYENAVKHNPSGAPCYVALANAYDSMRYAAAIHVTERTCDVQKLKEDALAAFAKAILLAPSGAEAYMRRGCFYLSLNEFRLAVADFEKGAALNPNIVGLYKPYWDEAKEKLKGSDY